MWLIVGLGNPGSRYETTRHNAGFLVVDAMADKEGVSLTKTQFKAQIGTGSLLGERCVFLKPQTYMNLSGKSVAQAMRFYKIPPSQVVVMHDDIDLPFGKVKAKEGGGHGGNNGVRSMIAELGDNGFHRVKLGIGRPGRGDKTPVADWVLNPFSQEELDTISREVVDETLMRIRGMFERKS